MAHLEASAFQKLFSKNPSPLYSTAVVQIQNIESSRKRMKKLTKAKEIYSDYPSHIVHLEKAKTALVAWESKLPQPVLAVAKSKKIVATVDQEIADAKKAMAKAKIEIDKKDAKKPADSILTELNLMTVPGDQIDDGLKKGGEFLTAYATDAAAVKAGTLAGPKLFEHIAKAKPLAERAAGHVQSARKLRARAIELSKPKAGALSGPETAAVTKTIGEMTQKVTKTEAQQKQITAALGELAAARKKLYDGKKGWLDLANRANKDADGLQIKFTALEKFLDDETGKVKDITTTYPDPRGNNVPARSLVPKIDPLGDLHTHLKLLNGQLQKDLDDAKLGRDKLLERHSKLLQTTTFKALIKDAEVVTAATKLSDTAKTTGERLTAATKRLAVLAPKISASFQYVTDILPYYVDAKNAQDLKQQDKKKKK